MNKFKISLLLLFTYISTSAWSQEKTTAQGLHLDLEDVIYMAKDNSIDAQKAYNERSNKYWSYRKYVSTTLPHLSLSGNIPQFTRSINPITQPDGSIEFRAQSQANSNLKMSLSQNLPWTGGNLAVNSELKRIDNFEGANEGVTWATNPFFISLNQPIFTYNSFKWDKKLEPMKYDESKKGFAERFEAISYSATSYFFDLLLAQINYDIATKNKANNDTIYRIGKGRYNLGKIAENELLQLELNLIDSERDASSAQIDMESALLSLNTFIGRPKGEPIDLVIPKEIPLLVIDPEEALSQAKQHREAYVSYKRRILEAKRDLAKAKGETSLNLNIDGSYGLTQQASTFSKAYQDPKSQQTFNVSLNIPIVDWSERRATRKTSEANLDLVTNEVEQDELQFEQEIIVLSKKLPIIYERVKSTQKADEVSQRQYEISRQRYMVANISITDLNLALERKDSSKREYLNALKDYWLAFYQLRQLTMFDFQKKEVITGPFVNDKKF